ncbi:MAG: RNA-binding protein [Patescibacteria group bacterium]
MGTKLYVGNLSYSATDDQLGELFSQAGAVVSANVITDRQTGRPRGFAFVEMASAEDAENAIKMLNGKDYDGRSLVVNEARPKEDRPSQGRN